MKRRDSEFAECRLIMVVRRINSFVVDLAGSLAVCSLDFRWKVEVWRNVDGLLSRGFIRVRSLLVLRHTCSMQRRPARAGAQLVLKVEQAHHRF